MSSILYHLVLKPLSYLPMWALHGLAKVVYWLVYYLIGYRKKLVFQNLTNSFPDKSPQEIKRIAKQFYRHFADVVVESISHFSGRKEAFLSRCNVENIEAIQQSIDKGRSAILTAGHYNNWELAGIVFPHYVSCPVYAIYSPLSDKFLDQKMKESRALFGLQLVSMKDFRTFVKEEREPAIYLFAHDQSPRKATSGIWLEFLHQQTLCLYGAEYYAQKYDWDVYYGSVEKIKRSHYTIQISPITNDPQNTAKGEITSKTMKALEKDILAEPKYWLWSHKRWKHKSTTS